MLGIFFICDSGLFLIKGSIFNFVFTFFMGVLLSVYGIFYEKACTASKKGVGKAIKFFIIGAACVFLFGSMGLFLYGTNDSATYDEDCVIVLGAGIKGEQILSALQYRLDKAIEYSGKNPKALIVVTGGQGINESVTEAYAMEKYLLAHNIPKDRIILEERATSTYENLLFSKEILDTRLKSGYKAAIITNGFHIFRAARFASLVGLDSSHLHADILWYNAPLNYVREVLAVIKMFILKM